MPAKGGATTKDDRLHTAIAEPTILSDTQSEEFLVGIAAVLAGEGVREAGRLEVLGVVGRLVERLHRAEQDQVEASEQLRGEKY